MKVNIDNLIKCIEDIAKENEWLHNQLVEQHDVQKRHMDQRNEIHSLRESLAKAKADKEVWYEATVNLAKQLDVCKELSTEQSRILNILKDTPIRDFIYSTFSACIYGFETRKGIKIDNSKGSIFDAIIASGLLEEEKDDK